MLTANAFKHLNHELGEDYKLYFDTEGPDSRDEYMKKIDIDFPNYDWCRNKGYGTKHHIKMILKYGKTIHHRLSFKIKPKQLNLQFNQ